MTSTDFKFSSIFFLILILFSSCSGLRRSPETIVAEGPPPAIIPLPQSANWGDNVYVVPEENIICYSAGSEKSVAWLQELLGGANIAYETTIGQDCGNWKVNLDAALEGEVGEEGYLLEVSDSGVALRAATEAGLFYGIQTLRQFFPAGIEQENVEQEQVFLRHGVIKDEPKYSWRGTMIDVARSFFGLEYLKSHVDRMALYKLNRLHLHLTDDQGWRIEIKSRPELAEIGSKGSVTGGRSGYLTQEEYKELQEYALARNIVIIPEIDMPGHIYSALIAIPELNCPEYANLTPARATPPETYPGYKVGWSKLCLEKPEIYDFVSEVVGELSEITEGPWIHIGGDEIDDPLYEEFVVKADSIVQTHGKTTIGWEEVTKAPVSSTLISQRWHGEVESVVDVKVIESICSHFYFDHANVPGQENTLNWCKEDGVSMENVYNFSTDNQNVLGVEAPVWTEHVLNDEMLDDRFWPRSIAVAEVAWSDENSRNFNSFKERLSEHGNRLEEMGIHYFPTPEIDWGSREVAEKPSTVFSGFMPE